MLFLGVDFGSVAVGCDFLLVDFKDIVCEVNFSSGYRFYFSWHSVYM